MKEIFSKRLRSARLRAGFSQDELVNRMSHLVTKNAISKYEKGQMMADSKVMSELARALGVKIDYFFQPFTVDIEQIAFRKKRKLRGKDLASIRQKVADEIERYIELERFLGIETLFVNPLADLVISSPENIELASEKLLEYWNLGFNALPGVIDMLESKEIKVIELEAPPEFDGLSGFADNKIPVIVINKNFSIERKRLTALHELGHLLLNFDHVFSENDIEKLCFRFGAALLIPAETFRKEFGDHRLRISLAELITIKETYGISIQAIMTRARDLGIISESRYLQFFKFISQNRTETGLGKYTGVEKTRRFRQLLNRAAAEEIISMSKAANLSNQKLAEFRKEFVQL